MAEEKDQVTEAGTEGEGQEGGGKKKLVIILVVGLLVVCIAAAAGFYFLKGGDDHAAEEAHVAEDVAPMPTESHYFELPDLTVNLASAGGNRFLRLKVVLEVGSAEDLARLEQVRPRIVDDFQVYLRELRPEDLRGSAGSYRLRHDLLLRANQAAQPARVVNVLFKEFLVQ
ncbi:MAG: flagellar basal body-associated protein FliL [Magnetococcales bacterium]|nr:flagellar basal body-associated protein FliL [Magnetococcales bacterium]|tara:strand:- start:171850 stop:172362 length:513 start_codon:yes stop_codon:yes gene_type:complete